MRKFFCPFLIFILTITFLSLVFSFSAGEEAGTPVSGDDHPSEEIVRAGENRGRFSVMTEKQRMTYIVPGDEYGENSKSSGRQRDLPCDAAGITDKGYSKTTRNAYGEPSPVHLGLIQVLHTADRWVQIVGICAEMREFVCFGELYGVALTYMELLIQKC